MRRSWRGIAAGALGAALLVLAGCGGAARQDANEPSGTYQVRVTRASFPAEQQLSQTAKMVIRVKNAGHKAIPDVAVTIDSFNHREPRADLADQTRPTWIVDKSPRGGDTAYVETWALGRLKPGHAKTFTWRVTAVDPGIHTVRYRVSAGLDGKAKAKLPGGGVPRGSFSVHVRRRPEGACVNGAGDVVRNPAKTGDNSCQA